MTGLLVALALCTGLVWLAVLGYPLLLLGAVALRRPRRPARRGGAAMPRVAVIIPTLDEESLILDKLANIRTSDYPRHLLSVWVVDGGSRDRTVPLVRRAIASGDQARLLVVDRNGGKLDQLRAALAAIDAEYLVVTDADAALDPSCVRELVRGLTTDQETGLVGAAVLPETRLVEERLHWRLVNALWWLEGEALSAATVSGVCYGVRRSAVPPLEDTGGADDVHVAMAVAAAGHRVRLCPAARAREQRVPRSLGDLLRFRRRRGGLYLAELTRSQSRRLPAGWRIARAMRLAQMIAVPWAAAAAVLLAGAALLTEQGSLALGVIAAPALSWLAVVLAVAHDEENRPMRMAAAVSRHAVMTWLALLTLVPRPSPAAAERSLNAASPAVANGDPVPGSSLPPPASV